MAQREVGADPREVGGAGEHDPLLALLDEGVVERGDDGPHEVAVGRARTARAATAGRRPRRSRRRPAAAALSSAAQAREQLLAAGATGRGRVSMTRCSTRPVSTMSTTMQPLGADRHELDVAHRRAGQRGVLHDGDLVGQRGEEAHRAVDDVVEVDRALEELRRWPRCSAALIGLTEEPVDEQPVAGVGGDPAGAGVRRGDQPLLLERRHVVAHGRCRDAELVALEQRLGADRLGGLDVVLDDGAQHGESAFLAHARRVSRRPGVGVVASRAGAVLALRYRVECQVYDAARERQVRRRCPVRRLAGSPRGRSREVEAETGLVVEDVETGWVGAVVRVEKAGGVRVVHLEDRRGRTKGFPIGPGFLLDGAPVVLTPPTAAGRAALQAARAAASRTASGSRAVEGARARVA